MKKSKTVIRRLGGLIIPTVIIASSLIISACTKVPSVSTSEGVLTITLHDKDGDFRQLKTFAISDTIGVISDNTSDQPIYNSESQSVVNNIVSNLTSRGFLRVTKAQTPDMVVDVSSIKVLNVATYYPGYWYGYGGYYGAYYWGYPGYAYYYPWTYTYTYTTGSMLIEIIDFKHKDVNTQKFKVIWNCFINGYVDASTNAAFVNTFVNKGFNQSPYIQSY